MMKVITMLMFLVLATIGSYAQGTVKRFCEVSVNGTRVKLNYGQRKEYASLKDSVFISKLLRVEQLGNLVRVLNYMSDMGWKYEWSIPDVSGYSGGSSTAVRVLFSKEFDRSAVNDQW